MMLREEHWTFHTALNVWESKGLLPIEISIRVAVKRAGRSVILGPKMDIRTAADELFYDAGNSPFKIERRERQ